MVYESTLPAIVKKMRLNSRLLTLIAASKIHSGWIPEEPDKDGIYVTPITGDLNQVVSSANQTNCVLQGNLQWQVDALSNESIEKSDLLARAACEACLPSIKTAGLFSLNFSIVNVSYDTGYNCYRATYRMKCPSAEHITG